MFWSVKSFSSISSTRSSVALLQSSHLHPQAATHFNHFCDRCTGLYHKHSLRLRTTCICIGWLPKDVLVRVLCLSLLATAYHLSSSIPTQINFQHVYPMFSTLLFDSVLTNCGCSSSCWRSSLGFNVYHICCYGVHVFVIAQTAQRICRNPTIA